jgi:hypothetical protein
MSDTYSGYLGSRTPGDVNGFLNAVAFIARQVVEKGWSTMPVKVLAVHGGGAAAGPPTVDVLPLVNQINGFGQPTPHGTIYKLPTARTQSGLAAIVCDPSVGDIGVAVFASHDITAVVATGNISNPGSRRRFDPSDGIYVITIIGAAPSDCAVILDNTGVEVSGNNANVYVGQNLGAGNGVSTSFPAGSQTVTVLSGIIVEVD